MPHPETPHPCLDGWVVDSQMYFTLPESVNFTVIPLKPQQTFLRMSPAERQWRKWKNEFGSTVVVVSVPDSTQETKRLVQPILPYWIHGMDIETLLSLYHETGEMGKSDEFEKQRYLRYRAAIIARTGKLPESVV